MKEAVILERGDALCVSLGCEIDHHSARIIREGVDSALAEKKPKEVILDFSDVSFMDSSGIGLIIGRAAKAEEIGAALTVKGLSQPLLRLVRMSGVTKLKGLKIID